MDMMGTPTRRMTARSRISSWGGGRGEGGHRGDRHREGAVFRGPHSTELGHYPSFHPSPGSSLLALHPGPRGPQRDTPGYRGQQEIPHLRHLSGSPPPVLAQNVHIATLAAPFRPVCPESSPSISASPHCTPHCTLARSRSPPNSPSPVPSPTKEGNRGSDIKARDCSGGGHPQTSLLPFPK